MSGAYMCLSQVSLAGNKLVYCRLKISFLLLTIHLYLTLVTLLSGEWLCDRCVSCPVLIWQGLKSRLLEVTQSLTVTNCQFLLSWHAVRPRLNWMVPWCKTSTQKPPKGTWIFSETMNCSSCLAPLSLWPFLYQYSMYNIVILYSHLL